MMGVVLYHSSPSVIAGGFPVISHVPSIRTKARCKVLLQVSLCGVSYLLTDGLWLATPEMIKNFVGN